jgi:hypothetical protein
MARLTEQRPEQQPAVVKAAPKKLEASAFAMPNIEFDAETAAKYQDSMPVIRRVAEMAARAVHDALSPQIMALQDAKDALEQNVNTSLAATRKPDANALLGSVHLQEFLDKPIPYAGGETIGKRLEAANNAEDLRTVTAIFNDLRSHIAAKPAGLTPAVTPGTVSATPQTPVTQRAKPRLAWSRREEAFKSFRAGQITQADLDKVRALYERAEAEGRINYEA